MKRSSLLQKITGLFINRRTLLSLVVAEALILSVLNHWLNLWGLPAIRQVLAAFALGPMLGVVISLLLLPVWNDVSTLSPRRWLLFLVPAAAIAGILAWRFSSSPEVKHLLTIAPIPGGSSHTIQLLEVKSADGSVLPLSTFEPTAGWSMQGNALSTSDLAAQPLKYGFTAPIGLQVRLIFAASPQGGRVRVSLDGTSVDLALDGSSGAQPRARLDTLFLWGPLNFLISPLLAAIDFTAILSLLAALWLAQEIAQRRNVRAAAPSPPERFLSHAAGLTLVCALALAMHFVNSVTVPLVVDKDSPSYLQGAVHWLSFHDFDGVSSYRGPGTTFLLLPFMALFGRDPWGVKIILHLLAVACVPLAYWLGWQLSNRRSLAFMAALLTALQPDLFGLASLVVSEVPHVFAALLYCNLLVLALRSVSIRWILAAALVGSLAVLVRAEDFAALLIGMVVLTVAVVRSWPRQASPSSEPGSTPRNGSAPPWVIALAVAVAAVPLLAWAAHNLRVYGFFGVSDYGGAVLYDGWIYYGESSGISFATRASPAVNAIQAVYPTQGLGKTTLPTSWTIFDALRAHGYTSEQAFALLGKASLDSIRLNPEKALRILALKIEASLQAFPILPSTFAPPGETTNFPAANAPYFDRETAWVPSLVPLQRSVYAVLGRFYSPVYGVWLYCCLLLLWLGLYRGPGLVWGAVVVLIANYTFLPTIIGVSAWRYVLVGRVLMQVAALPALSSLGVFVWEYVRLARSSRGRDTSTSALEPRMMPPQ